MIPAEYEQWVEQARARVRERMADSQAHFGLGTYARYEIDLPSATIRFLDSAGRERVRADLQISGSWSPASETWMWGWENQSVPEITVSRLREVREAGHDKGIDSLKASIVECDEGGAWSLASLAADILDAQCVYRVVREHSHLYLLLFSIQKLM